MLKGYCGKTDIEGGKYDVITTNGQFKLFNGSKFVKYVANTTLRKFGIFSDDGKKIYGQHGYIGSVEPQRGVKEAHVL